MAVPSYTTDLTSGLIHACDATSANWSEPTGFAVGGIVLPETDYFIQNTGCLSKNQQTVGGCGAIYNYGSGVTIPTDGAFLVWQIYAAPNSLAVQYPGGASNGGLQIFVGSSATAFKQYFIRGSDTYAYGGWICTPVNPTVTPDLTTGSPTSTVQYFGGGAYAPTFAATKGNVFGMDVLRYGRCEARFANGSLADGVATFAGFAAINDAVANRWGLIQTVSGGYQTQGLVVFGYSSAVYFEDSNTSIVIANTEKVTPAFNAFEVRQAGSHVKMTSISFLALGTVSRGNWITTDNATVILTSCSFTDMGTFGFQSNTTVTSCTFSQCNLVTHNGAVLSDCTFDSTNDATRAVLSNDPSKISGCTFKSSGTGHAIELTSACMGNSYAFDGNNFTGYAASNGSSGNEVIYNNSGGTVTLNVTTSGTGTISVMNSSGSITNIATSAALNITVVDSEGNAVNGTEVTVVRTSDGTELYHQESLVGNTTTYSYSTGQDTVDVNVVTTTGYGSPVIYYVPKTVGNVTIPSSGSKDLLVQLDQDRVYSNP